MTAWTSVIYTAHLLFIIKTHLIMFHKEGNFIIITTFIICAVIALSAEYFVVQKLVKYFLQVGAIVVLVLVLQFFRNPNRNTVLNENHLLSPVDGKVVIIEEVFEKEYFKDQRLQVSIFMSPINVHVTRYPMSGKVKFSKYHPGKYLVAWHPKSSELNERTTIVVENEQFGEVLYRQIADAVHVELLTMPRLEIRQFKAKTLGLLSLVHV